MFGIDVLMICAGSEHFKEVGGQQIMDPIQVEPNSSSIFPCAVRQKAYTFDGFGNFHKKEWDLKQGTGKNLSWYHVELPKGDQKLHQSAQSLINVLCPPLNLQDILSLVSNGPFCGYVNGALVFRVNSPGPVSSDYTFRIAARVTENSVITVSLGRVPRLGFSPMGHSLLSEIPSVESPEYGRGRQKDSNGIVIREHVLEFLLTMNHSEEADNPVPRSVSNLIVHIVDTHVDHLQDMVTKLEIELEAVEIELDKGGFVMKKQMLDDRRFPKMHLNLQRLLQAIPRTLSKTLCGKGWRQAMQEEMTALTMSNTRELVPRPPGTMVVCYRLVYAVKEH